MPGRLPLTVLVLVACGGKPASRPIVDEAAHLLALHPFEEVRSFVALARAQVAAKQLPAAKASLARALDIARRADTGDAGTAMIEGIDVLVALGDEAGATALRDEALAKIGAMSFRSIVIEEAFAPDLDIETKLALDTLATLALEAPSGTFDKLEVGGPAWQAMLAKIEADVPEKWWLPLDLARRARAAGKLAEAKAMAERAAKGPLEKPEHRLDVAEAAALAGANETAKQLIANLETFEEPAVGFAVLARIHAILGDTAASAAADKRARAAKPTTEEADRLRWQAIILALAKRGDLESAFGVAEQHVSKYLASDVAYGLFEQGQRDVVDAFLATVPDEHREAVTDRVVHAEIQRGELAAARKRAITDDERVAVAYGYARAGTVAPIRELLPPTKDDRHRGEDAIAIAARQLAKRGKCDEAVAATKGFLVRGAALAVIGRYCPTTKL